MAVGVSAGSRASRRREANPGRIVLSSEKASQRAGWLAGVFAGYCWKLGLLWLTGLLAFLAGLAGLLAAGTGDRICVERRVVDSPAHQDASAEPASGFEASTGAAEAERLPP